MVHQEQITNLLVSVFFNAWASFLFNIFSCFIWIFFCAEQFLQPNRNWSSCGGRGLITESKKLCIVYFKMGKVYCCFYCYSTVKLCRKRILCIRIFKWKRKSWKASGLQRILPESQTNPFDVCVCFHSTYRGYDSAKISHYIVHHKIIGIIGSNSFCRCGFYKLIIESICYINFIGLSCSTQMQSLTDLNPFEIRIVHCLRRYQRSERWKSIRI